MEKLENTLSPEDLAIAYLRSLISLGTELKYQKEYSIIERSESVSDLHKITITANGSDEGTKKANYERLVAELKELEIEFSTNAASFRMYVTSDSLGVPAVFAEQLKAYSEDELTYSTALEVASSYKLAMQPIGGGEGKGWFSLRDGIETDRAVEIFSGMDYFCFVFDTRFLKIYPVTFDPKKVVVPEGYEPTDWSRFNQDLMSSVTTVLWELRVKGFPLPQAVTYVSLSKKPSSKSKAISLGEGSNVIATIKELSEKVFKNYGITIKSTRDKYGFYVMNPKLSITQPAVVVKKVTKAEKPLYDLLVNAGCPPSTTKNKTGGKAYFVIKYDESKKPKTILVYGGTKADKKTLATKILNVIRKHDYDAESAPRSFSSLNLTKWPEDKNLTAGVPAVDAYAKEVALGFIDLLFKSMAKNEPLQDAIFNRLKRVYPDKFKANIKPVLSSIDVKKRLLGLIEKIETFGPDEKTQFTKVAEVIKLIKNADLNLTEVSEKAALPDKTNTKKRGKNPVKKTVVKKS